MKYSRLFGTFLLSLAHFTAVAQAETIVVDDDGGAGVDFLDIQAAIDSAQTGDILLVYPGTYPEFNLGIGLTIIAADPDNRPVVYGFSAINQLPSPQRAVLSGLRVHSMDLYDNPGHITFDNVDVVSYNTELAALDVKNCVDVRLYQCFVRGSNGDYYAHTSTAMAAYVSNSRFEAIDSTFQGGHGMEVPYYDFNGSGPGGDGIYATNFSILALFDTACVGGDGGDNKGSYGFPAGDGGDGLVVSTGSAAVLAGIPYDRNSFYDDFQHGRRGYNWGYGVDGIDGTGLVVFPGNSLRYSDVAISSMSLFGSNSTLAIPPDPFFQRFGTLQAGRQQTFRIHGTPGDSVTLYLGRAPQITVDPLQEMDDLVSHQRAWDLGVIPPSGVRVFQFTIPNWFPDSFHFFAQAATTDAAGLRRTTNSIPIVLRYLP